MSTHLLPRLGLGKMFVALPLVPPQHFPDFPSLKLIVGFMLPIHCEGSLLTMFVLICLQYRDTQFGFPGLNIPQLIISSI